MKILLIIITFIFFTPTTIAQNRPDSMPVYPGCETAEQKMPCLKDKLLNFISENFNQDLLYEIKDAKTVEMLITFVINTDGKLSDIKIQSSYNQLNEAMKKVLLQLPGIKPAQVENNPVSMQYQLPVSFEIKK